MKGATSSAIGNATTAFNSAAGNNPTTAAIVDQTSAITAQQGVTNDYLRQLVNNTSVGIYKYGVDSGYSDVGVYNGRLMQSF